MSLVPDYGSSSSESEECEDFNNSSNLLLYEETENDDCAQSTNYCMTSDKEKSVTPSTLIALPSASKLLSGIASVGDVFHNPYKLAETEKIASLEKHVKMVATDEHTYVKNGKKMCWNFRKGRCRFGSNCTYAHDSDIHEMNSDAQHKVDTKQMPSSKTTTTTTASTTVVKTKRSQHEQKRKHPGLGNSIVPSKKVIKQYNMNKVLK